MRQSEQMEHARTEVRDQRCTFRETRSRACEASLRMGAGGWHRPHDLRIFPSTGTDATQISSWETYCVTKLDQIISLSETYGWAVFPCKPHEKIPATPHGFKDASRDPDQIRAWFDNETDFNVAIATGAV